MLTKILKINQSPWYWGGLALFGVMALAIALYFQYAREEWPCVLCIHVRIWVLGIALVALPGLILRRNILGNIFVHGLLAVMAIGLLERSLVLLGTERGTVFGACSMELGLPTWFALDKWFPLVFEVQASCGYTPELLFGITMAEGLVAVSVLLVMLAGLQLVVLLLDKIRNP